MLKELEKYPFKKSSLKILPQKPGVYIYRSGKGKVIYVGKAINIKKRVESYFQNNLGIKTKALCNDCRYISTIAVGSEVEALLLEARLIKKFKPFYNSAQKDDKNPLYIRITNEKYPRVLTARKYEEDINSGKKDILFIGPFPSSGNVKSVLHLLRRIIPFSQHKLGKRACIYKQMGLCNPCPNEIDRLINLKTKKLKKVEYRKNINYTKAILLGKFSFVQNSLERLMRKYSKDENFEMAAILRNQIIKLNYITAPVTPVKYYLKNPNLIEDIRSSEIEDLRLFISRYIKIDNELSRIECFDVAHLTGINPTASMVTFIDGEEDKTLYRHFKISLPAGKAGQKKGQSDTDSMREVAKRRVKYLSSWGIPDLIIVDGGKAQVAAFVKVFSEYRIHIVGLSKRFETLVIPLRSHPEVISGSRYLERVIPNGPSRNLVQRIRDESHRFARRYHHKLLRKDLIPT